MQQNNPLRFAVMSLGLLACLLSGCYSAYSNDDDNSYTDTDPSDSDSGEASTDTDTDPPASDDSDSGEASTDTDTETDTDSDSDTETSEIIYLLQRSYLFANDVVLPANRFFPRLNAGKFLAGIIRLKDSLNI